ncbi:unknown [Prevotella sp. CAG:5226]|nr:unknown [Prevotella sp. CAG:5226]
MCNVTLALLANVLVEGVSKVDLCGLNHRARRMQSSLLELLSRSR